MSTAHTEDTNGGRVAIASAIAPGWGHVLVGRGRVGRVLLLIDGLFVVAVLGVVFFFQVELLKAWVTPSSIVGILILNVAVLAYRGAATIDSFTSATGRGWHAWLGLVLALLVVIGPHLLLGGLAATQLDLLGSVFADEEPLSAVATTTTAAGSIATTTTTSAGLAPPTTSLSTTTTTPPPRIWDGKDRLNILLLGSDAGEGRIGTRTDTVLLASIDPESGNVAMFSVPRNFTFAPLPEGMGLWECQCFPDIIAHLWANGEWYPDAFPGPQEPSINALKAAVGLTFGLEVHYYAKVDLKGFVGVVDALGGVTIDVPQTIVDETYPHEDGGSEYLVIEKGTQHLDGHLALAYARIRRHSGDFARMHRQRCVLGALAAQANPVDIVAGFGELATAVKENVVTDIPVNRLGDLVELLPKINPDTVATLRITRYNYGLGGNDPGQQRYDIERLRADAWTLMNDPTAQLETLDGVGLDDTCEESFD